jgi:tetratricopeptide (TPR) repeat protein
VGFRHQSSAGIRRDAALSFSTSGIGISARTGEPAEPGGSTAAPLPDASRPRFELRPRRGAIFARRYRRAFRRGLDAFARDDVATALAEMEQALERGGADLASVQAFVAFCFLALGRLSEAATRLRRVATSDAPLPDRLMRRHVSSGILEIHVTPRITAHAGIDRGGVALLLVEILQHLERNAEAIDLLETIGAHTQSAAVALCLADRYLADGAWGEVDRVTDMFTSNVDDLSLQILILRARAQRERGAFIPALTTLREALRFRKRDPLLMNEARYERALLYESEGKHALARKDLERIFNHEPDFRDVAKRLSSPWHRGDYDLELLPSDAG